MTTLFNPLVETHINQNYGSFHQEIPFDDLIRKYAILPNEAVYLVECRTAQLEPLTSNFNDIIGIDILHPKDITILYEHVHPTAMQPFMQFTHKVVQCGFEKSIKLLALI